MILPPWARLSALGYNLSSMEIKPQPDSHTHPMGDDAGIDLRRPMARKANDRLRKLKGQDTIIDLGEHGEIDVDHVRFRDDREQGQLIAYIRQEAADHKVIVPVVVALGVVAAGIYNLKYRKKG
jgi:hypothetical protein